MHICREVGEDFEGSHLIYTAMGGPGCYSYVGRVGESGQKINLGSPECTHLGHILHETMHGLGLILLSLNLFEFLKSYRIFQELCMSSPGQIGTFTFR